MAAYRAVWAEQGEDGKVTAEVRELPEPGETLPEGGVRIRVRYSSLNYKDALAATAGGGVVRAYPITPGIDLAGIVERSRDERFRAGDEVLATGFGLGVEQHGGLAELAQVPGDWLMPLPAGLSAREAMALGTAGFTAALSVDALLSAGIAPADGPALVTGASGGVGSFAVAILAAAGFTVAAVSGKAEAADYLRRLGAAEIIPRAGFAPELPRPLAKQQWACAVDPVGGRTLAHVLASLRYGGAVAASGMAGGGELAATVFPFILRGVRLLGIDSVWRPMADRLRIWPRLSGEWKPALLDEIVREIPLADVPETLPELLAGRVRGRLVVRVNP